jgi:hypothetical protein
VEISIRKREHMTGWVATMPELGKRTAVGAGATKAEALGNLVIAAGPLFGVDAYRIIDDTRGTEDVVPVGPEGDSPVL